MTPTQLDKDNKARQTTVKKATLATKWKMTVVAAAAANGGGALSAELQNQEVGPTDPIPTSPPPRLIHTTAPAATGGSLQVPNVSQNTTPSPLPTLMVPPKLKCEGCVHCDLLELKILEPVIVKHYLKTHEFL